MAVLTTNTCEGQCCGTWEVETACYSTAYSAQDAPLRPPSSCGGQEPLPLPRALHTGNHDTRTFMWSAPPPWAQLGKGALALQSPCSHISEASQSPGSCSPSESPRRC